MNELPTGWVKVSIGSFARIVGGGTPPSKDPANFAKPGEGIPWITPADLSGYRSQTIKCGSRDLTPDGLAACGATLMPAGTVLFSSRAPIGYVAIAANEIATNQGFKSFVLPGGFDPRFTYYQLKHLKPEAEAIATGTTFKELSGAAAATLPFSVAPMQEQTRIADRLDALLTRINACNDRLVAIPELINRFRHAVLDAATSGALTLDWREQQQNMTPAFTNATGFNVEEMHVLPGGWRWERFGSFLSSFRSGTSVVPGNAETAFPVLRSSSVRPMRIDFEDVRYFSDPSRVRNEDLLVEGDLLFTRLSGSLEYVANCSVVRGLGSRRIYYPDRLFRAKLNRPEQGSYLELCFASPSLRKRLTVETKSTAGHQRISMGAVTNFPIPMPPAEEQEEILHRVNALFKLADSIEVRYRAGSLQAQRLIPLVLAKAFRGDLLPQDPSDEPASSLLARMAPSRGGALLVPKIRQPRTPRAARAPKEYATMTKSRQDDEVKGKPYLAGHLRSLGEPVTAQVLFKVSELQVADFYKQLAWELEQGLVKDNTTTLEPGHAAR